MAGESQPSHPATARRRREPRAGAIDAVAASAPGLIWSAGSTAANDWLSPSWASYTGRSGDELRGDGWLALVHPEDLERCRGIRATSFEARSAVHARLAAAPPRRRSTAGSLDNGVPRFDADGARGRLRRQRDRHRRAQAARGVARRADPGAAPRRAPPGPVPGDALARAAQSAGADRQRRQRAAHARAQQPDPGSPARDPRAPGRPARPPGRGADRRDPRRPGPDLAGPRAGLDRRASSRRRSRASHDKLNAGRHRLEVDVPDERLYVRGDAGAAGAGARAT